MHRPNDARRVAFECEGESLTKQALAYEADVNVIVARYIKTGDATAFNLSPGRFADVSDIGDYASCLANVEAARAAFAELPAKVRDQFGNDPANLLEAASDPRRRSELEAAGIVVPEARQTSQKAPGADTAAASSSAGSAAAAAAGS